MVKEKEKMKKLTGDQIRTMFLDYFESKNHMVEPGASLIPHNDPTLLWINAGVAALKKYFDGSEKPRNNRIVNAQKSIRTNDIENVGKTARHHTFFEMLGNFSIGDYFKEDAIQYAWEFLTDPKWIGFDKSKMYISVHTDDEEAYRIWTEICHVDPSHILKSSDNFWQIGEGPCGPNSELFYDRGTEYDPENIGEKLFFEELENDRYIEIWNVVFSQFDGKEGVDRKDFKELPQKNIDTGMGFERLVAIVQEGETNFDTDVFLPIIHATEKLSKLPYHGENKMAYRVIADHIRTVTFAIADGANFSNEGRGYVLRRVLRRAVRYGIKLGIQGAFMYQLVEVVAKNMHTYYPYLIEKVAFVAKLVKSEEESFHSTLNNGEKLLQEVLNEASKDKLIAGEVVFKLYDTYGFPKELTEEIASEKGYKVDTLGFEIAMNQQRKRSSESREVIESFASQSIDLMNFTDSSAFVGYDQHECDAKVIACFKEGVRVKELSDEGDIVLSSTCFYAESGGQVADIGVICGKNSRLDVVNVSKAPHKQFMHHVLIKSGKVVEGDLVHGTIDEIRRNRITANHSSVHLLQSALKQVVGNHVAQAGSYVSDEYARFDFTHFEKVSEKQLKEIEELVNNFIMEHHSVTIENLTMEAAKQTGAIALFDEKYGDVVRVVSMGNVSKEFCGGTHVMNTQEIGLFKIDSEESIGSGIRRITVKTGIEAYHTLIAMEEVLSKIATELKMSGVALVEQKVAQLVEENSLLRKELEKANGKLLMHQADEMLSLVVNVQSLNIIIASINQVDAQNLKLLAENVRNKMSAGLIFLSSVVEDKLVFVAACSAEAIKAGFKAGDLVKEAATISGGNGGGRPDLAQAGGKDLSAESKVLKTIRTILGITL